MFTVNFTASSDVLFSSVNHGLEQPEGEKIKCQNDSFKSQIFKWAFIYPTMCSFNCNNVQRKPIARASPFCTGARCKGCSGGLWVALRGDPFWSCKVAVRDPW